ncbi:sensor histidine kinase [sulfur-oxidizing endosymbiont of Gigantopelta aegis]|uniref:sensor histidine kinase n=1 Tax=sulfur-oxidizing endosymbiont of Gigantopelta aegis TaxID=2794934 RepID=UPI0018DB30F0|nr:ATP-binding protein [sulfur-oxidizing endosymbiont of Gigantopelta aegis]
MSLTKQLRLFVAIIIVMALFSLSIYFELTHSVREHRKNYENLNTIIQGVFELNLLTTEYLSVRSKRSETQWKKRHASLTNQILISSRSVGNKSRQILMRARFDLANIRSLFFKILVAHQQIAIDNKHNLRLVKRLADQVRLTSQKVVSDINRVGTLTLITLKETEAKAISSLQLLMVLVFLVLVGIMIWVQRSFIVPITKLKDYSEKLIGGDYHRAIKINGKNEMADLAMSFNTLAVAIADKIERLTEQTVYLEDSKVQLEVTNKELESYAYSISHDLRSPLRSIDGFSLVLLEDFGDTLDEEALGYLQRIRTGTKKMSELITELLNISRIMKEGMKLEKIDLQKMANEEINVLRDTYIDKNIQFSCAKLSMVVGDNALLRSVIENLLNNAIKYSQKEDPIIVKMGLLQMQMVDESTKEVHNQSVFFVKDNGVGFDMKHKNKLFKPFQRLHKVNEFEGSGIGLATVQRILIRHNGEIWAESVMGQGATFYFTLNLSEEELIQTELNNKSD